MRYPGIPQGQNLTIIGYYVIIVIHYTTMCIHKTNVAIVPVSWKTGFQVPVSIGSRWPSIAAHRLFSCTKISYIAYCASTANYRLRIVYFPAPNHQHPNH